MNTIQQRNIGLAIVFSIITCGIYLYYWMYQISNDTRILSGDTNGSAGTDLVLEIVTCGIYGFFIMYQSSKRLYQYEVAQGVPGASDDSMMMTLLYALAGIVGMAILQSKINAHATA